MSLSIRRKAADNAAASLVEERRRQSVQYGGLLNLVDRWRPAVLIGAGLAGGALLARRQTARLASGALSLASFGMAMMRTPLGPLALAALFRKRTAPTPEH